MKKFTFLTLTLLLCVWTSGHSQSEKPATKEIEFKYRYERADFDIIKFFVTGDLTQLDPRAIAYKITLIYS